MAIPTATIATVSQIGDTPTLPTVATPLDTIVPTHISAPTLVPTALPTADSSTSNVPTVAPTAAPTEATTSSNLTERIEAALALSSQRDWLEAWEFYTLSFRESCPKETFAAQARTGMAILRMMTNVPLGDSLEFRLMSVTVEGDTALVGTRIFHQGEPWKYGAEDELESWVL